MEHKLDDSELDQLLDRGGPGPARRDAILAAVLSQTRAQRTRSYRARWATASIGLAAAAALTVAWFGHRDPETDAAAFRERGPALANPSLAVECIGAPLTACPTGSLLGLRVEGMRGYLSAWAEPIGGGERIWYFSGDTNSPWIDPASEQAGFVPRAVKIGPEHRPGTYVVELRVTDRPMRGAELLSEPQPALGGSSRALLTVINP